MERLHYEVIFHPPISPPFKISNEVKSLLSGLHKGKGTFSRPNGRVVSDADCDAVGTGVNPVEDFLEEEGICRMEWPAKSPDQNSFENMWDVLGRAISRR
ncbi:hypothetical protein TNCV_4434961 [Trichonephila clavipes]|nr:hypothetical protein TNCV_4434961 [Trichonephila clavipes]